MSASAGKHFPHRHVAPGGVFLKKCFSTSISRDCAPYLVSWVPDRQETLEVQRQPSDLLPLLGDLSGGWPRNFFRLLRNASQHPLGISAGYLDIFCCCAPFSPQLPLFSLCSVSASAREGREGRHHLEEEVSGLAFRSARATTSLLGVWAWGEPDWTDWKDLSLSSGLLGSGTKVHRCWGGCHLEVTVEKPPFYGFQHWTFHGLLPGRRLLSAASEIVFKFFMAVYNWQG